MQKTPSIIPPLALLLSAIQLFSPSALFSAPPAPPAPPALENFRDLSQKEIFKDRTYPRYLAFRGEMNRKINTDYETWRDALGDSSGVMRKFMNEELLVNPSTAAWANRYAREHPEKLVMLHLNGEARQVAAFPEVLRRYFPGHWVYLAGSKAAAAVKNTDTTIHLESARPFTMRGYVNHNTGGATAKPPAPATIPQNVLLVRVDKQGRRLWNESEYAKLTAVNYAARSITIQRGQFHTTPRDYAAGELYVAPIAGSFIGKDVMWYYNLSANCPKDANGRQAWELYADEIASWFSPAGALRDAQGIAFDVNYFEVPENRKNWDTDNDGKPDGGWSDGRNRWAEGDWKFLTRLRAALGRDFILTSDAQHPTNQQAVGILDGMESEGLVQDNDAWRGFSRAVNTHLYWKDNNTSDHDYRYVVLKLNDADDAARPQQMRRFAAATACCLEACVTDALPRDYMPPAFSAPGSLGKARGELARNAKTAPQLFPAGIEYLKTKIEAPGCDVTLANGKIQIRRSPTAQPEQLAQPERRLKFKIKDAPLPAGDVTIYIKARALDPLDGFVREDRVPRIIWLRPTTLPDYGEGARRNEYYTRIYGMIGMRRAGELSYYFRRLPAGAQDLEIEAQGTGAIELESLEIYNAPDILARRFDKAIVLVNPSLTPARVNIAALLGPECKTAGEATIPAVDAVFIPVE